MNVIKRIEQIPLSFTELRRMLRGMPATLIHYDDLSKYKSLTELFAKSKSVIILLEIENGRTKVGHWIALLEYSDHIEHFDSYGLDIDEELSITHERNYLTQLFRNSSKRLESSGKKLQAMREHVNTCGRWVVARLLLRAFEMKEFLAFVAGVHQQPDVMVTLLTMFL